MNKFRFTINALAIAIFTFAFASFAQAQATRTFVSGVGNDANPCSRTAPCKTLPGAFSKTAAGGEIDCLDPGGFGAVTITKSITIDCASGDTGAVGSILVAGTNAIVVQAGPTDVVFLRKITINGISEIPASAGLSGIRFLSGKSLNIENVNVMHFSKFCVDMATTAATASSLYVSDSNLTDCGNNSVGGGVNLLPAGGRLA